MAEKLPQTYANHTRFDPPFHFFLAPGAILLLVLTVINVVRHPQMEAWILLLIAILIFGTLFLARVYPLRAQDRVIRLEERLRLERILPAGTVVRIPELTEAQLVAIRFASDRELAVLVEKILATKMSPRDIKKNIATWRADTFRV